MVFMQFKYYPDGKYEELSIKIIDTGIGLERIPWLINGSPTSYYDIFKHSLPVLQKKLEIDMNNEIWEKLGPYSSQLNIDEVDDVDKTWEGIADLIEVPVEKVKSAISPVKDLYVILDHTRTCFMIIRDGGLPSNVGGGSNCRNILRRVFAILKKNNWWDKLGGIDGLLEIFNEQERDLAELYGKFEEYKSFNDIIKIEYQRWLSTDTEQQKKLVKLVEKNKGKLSIDDWILVMQSWGIPADAISEITKIPIPGNLYY
jgi:alanyl-tRNA synthetase